jgi:serpin B
MKRRIIAGVLCLVITISELLSLSGCGTAQAADLMANVKSAAVSSDIDLTGNYSDAIADFAVRLFQNTVPADGNPLISPLSIVCALAMTANGAKGETLAQMEDVFGLPVQELNKYLHAYMERLPVGDKYKVSLANSIWFKDDDRLKVEQDFLQKNADYYGASIYKAAFDDTTLKEINGWVSDKTDGMIKDILDKIPAEAVMYLVNALAFDAEWQNIYKENQVRDGTFTTESGTARNAKMMYSSEHMYLNDGDATGFIKYYADRKYAFAALLPNEGVPVAEYIASLTGEGLRSTLENARSVQVNTAIPKFESDYSLEMSDVLVGMGMPDAFDAGLADFTGLGLYDNGKENIFINRVIHKTYIALDEKGTKAGAATVVEMVGTTAVIEPEEIKTVYLDRPFVYMLIDCETNLPLFIGAAMDIGE